MDALPPFPPLAQSSPFLRFPVGDRLCRADRLVPVFLPFAGCPRRCVYCAQDRQTGSATDEDPAAILARTEKNLDRIRARGLTAEIAFYGGTFTSLPPADREACLVFFRRQRASGRVIRGRCSTRPDAVAGGRAGELARFGIDLVELGVQSFDDRALRLAGRGYNGQTAREGCRKIQEAGLSLGIQLLPGMPGVTPEVFLDDVDQALSLRPACLRFYPCLVPEGTGLAALWRRGEYRPWSSEETVTFLGEGLKRAWAARTPVIRLAVAPEAAFDAALLAGPRHPALGALIQAQALLATVDALLPLLGTAPAALLLPRRCQGYLYGDRGSLRSSWRERGLPPERIQFTDEPDACLLAEEALSRTFTPSA